jgi:hypothetical protein
MHAGIPDSGTIAYRYTVDGVRHTGHRISLNDYAHLLQRFAAEHKEGECVSVYYNPSSPSQSLLVPGAGGQSFGHSVFGAILFWLSEVAVIAFGAGFLYFVMLVGD